MGDMRRMRSIRSLEIGWNVRQFESNIVQGMRSMSCRCLPKLAVRLVVLGLAACGGRSRRRRARTDFVFGLGERRGCYRIRSDGECQ
jgi:hypothetical protein